MFKSIIKLISNDKEIGGNILDEQNLKVPIHHTIMSKSTYWALGVTYVYMSFSEDDGAFLATTIFSILKIVFYNALDNKKRTP